jgi:hemoglobin-like flavoprotein
MVGVKAPSLARELRTGFVAFEKLRPRQVTLVQASWRQTMPVKDTLAELFYGKLFSLAPDVRVLFKNDLKEQGRNLTAMMSVAIASLSQPERILTAVRQLGRRHAAYGVQPHHYTVVGTALLWALETTLGEAFTPEVESAWTDVYRLLASTMQEAAVGR